MPVKNLRHLMIKPTNARRGRMRFIGIYKTDKEGMKTIQEKDYSFYGDRRVYSQSKNKTGKD